MHTSHAGLSMNAARSSSSAASAPGAAGAEGGGDDRSTSFQAVEGGTEHKSGEGLLVASYAGLWALLLLWVFFQWNKQTALARRIGELETAVAAATKGKAGAGGAGRAA